MGNSNPKREAVDAVVARAIHHPGGYELVHQTDDGAGGYERHTIFAVHPTTGEPLKDDDGIICELFRPTIVAS
ncbi:MAG: hypothetical protein A2921_03890 [Candidatus Magasanikbacteria bacterium RIFCSPLOWO2_01_FULL_43_20b]|uniref:Uncharacterized protein n=1 Tax=Candidatus Magasanikbacteria bacterium RIFCSPLOWO2_12_FULL_43_12 TaxID=1798692 RepID=A0A1F6MS59_9BACT|nr:MAG: hypothetical protein A3C74_03505 [Candidatus Magasanikbacteria bacterium RIFCSPHIGHO2_02_FULL_44_13]OGH72561.1 MAG: hypothetical protein A3I93_03460 [Candidatus Magasanikbacteria bacterium RIFCSPLOWO2_02_FULL_43_22]OGH73612.1 MAG: hypothetical protein A2921_03890 [Candidatus Magasanikbacteria bacterium RIFCSPLOWO2_01_FULL_43_20b]OGH74505.1 MAG: hypothetical protein A3G00_01810 [Candidatus Magasanikbacteria bacterium RIFCSPLOWO2_12_FULL_43_12]